MKNFIFCEVASSVTAQKKKFCVKNFFRKCDQFSRKFYKTINLNLSEIRTYLTYVHLEFLPSRQVIKHFPDMGWVIP